MDTFKYFFPLLNSIEKAALEVNAPTEESSAQVSSQASQDSDDEHKQDELGDDFDPNQRRAGCKKARIRKHKEPVASGRK